MFATHRIHDSSGSAHGVPKSDEIKIFLVRLARYAYSAGIRDIKKRGPCLNGWTAEDISQQSVVIALTRLASDDPKEQLNADQLVTEFPRLVSRAIGHARGREAKRNWRRRQAGKPAINFASTDDVNQSSLVSDEKDIRMQLDVAGALCAIPPLERRILQSRMRGQSVNEACQELGISTSSYYHFRDKAIKAMAAMLKEYDCNT